MLFVCAVLNWTSIIEPWSNRGKQSEAIYSEQIYLHLSSISISLLSRRKRQWVCFFYALLSIVKLLANGLIGDELPFKDKPAIKILNKGVHSNEYLVCSISAVKGSNNRDKIARFTPYLSIAIKPDIN